MKIIQIAERLSRVRSVLVAMEKYGQRQMESIHEGYRYAAREWELHQSCIFPKKVGGCRTFARITTTKWTLSAILTPSRPTDSGITGKHRWTMCNSIWMATMPKYEHPPPIATIHFLSPNPCR